MKTNYLDILKNKGSGFKVPKGYFETIEAAVMTELIADRFPKKHGFTTPKGYFKALDDDIASKSIEEKLPVKDGYAAPDGYFDAVENEVFAKLNTKVQNTNSSGVPEGYFDALEDAVFAKLKKEKLHASPKVISLGSRIKKVLLPVAVAASIALVVIMNYNGSDKTVNKIAATEIDEWIDEEVISFDSYEIAEVYSDTELASNDTNDEDDALLDYLNGMDVESMVLEN